MHVFNVFLYFFTGRIARPSPLLLILSVLHVAKFIHATQSYGWKGWFVPNSKI